MEISKRIIALIEILGISPGEFADKIGVQRSGISHITSGRNKPSLDFLESTLTVFPDINSEWLILGKGKPLKSQSGEKTEEKMNNIAPKLSNSEPSPLLFPIDDSQEAIIEDNEQKITNNEEVNIFSSLHTHPTDFSKNVNVNKIDEETIENNIKSKIEKKEVKKMVILYTDNSFEVYEN